MTKREGPFWDFVAGRAPAPPAADLLGWQLLDVDPDQGTIRVQFDARPEFRNPAGTIQGGILAAMLDDTMGPALVATLGPDQFALTLELKTNFIRPAKIGVLVGEGRIVHRGGTVCFLEGSLRDAEGTLVATATATARLISTKERERATANTRMERTGG